MPSKAKPKSAKAAKPSTGLSADERAALKERLQELKAAASKADGEKLLLAKVAAMAEPDRSMAKRIHALMKATAPQLAPRTFYGMPAYAKDDKVVCFFQSGRKFKTRYCTFGFQQDARLDEGAMWPTSYALTKLTANEEARIAALVKKAIS